jgi:aspartate/methionine/tyrosine aminotransferase
MHAEIVEAAHRAMMEGQIHYVEALGTRTARNATARKVRRLNRMRAEPDDVALCPTSTRWQRRFRR